MLPGLSFGDFTLRRSLERLVCITTSFLTLKKPVEASETFYLKKSGVKGTTVKFPPRPQ